MSIFKDTLDPQVYAQLQARQEIIDGENSRRSPLLPWYLSKNSWVRMTSFTNFNDGPLVFPGNGEIKTDTTKGHYKGDQLSKKYILQGGTLYTKENNGKTIGALRKGILGDDGAYGGNIDYAGSAEDDYFRRWGIRPMPGITGVDLTTKSAYGSLYQTKIKYFAWDVHQLNELELLFMRPGYSVLLEWGWSQYIDNKGYPVSFTGGTINPFDPSLTVQKVYDKMQAAREKWDYNYDAMLGYVTNFNWTLLPHGGYDCETTLISMGEVMSSLKIASSANLTKQSTDLTFEENEKRFYYDDYETILLSIKAKAEGSQPQSGSSSLTEIKEDQYKGKWDSRNSVTDTAIADKLRQSGWTKEADNFLNSPLIKFIKQPEGEGELGEQGSRYEYITLPVWIAIMDSYFSYKISENEKLVKFQPLGAEDYCLAGQDSISTDLTVCAVNNPHAFQEFVHVKPQGYTFSGINPCLNLHKNYDDSSMPLVDFDSFYDAGKKMGIPANIYVNVDLLLREYTSMKQSSNDDGVELMVYVQNILNKISNALGGLNNFRLSTAGRDHNIMRVIDLYYLEQKSGYDEKAKLNLMGLKSIFRSVKINSKVFEQQSTIMAIAAQSRANLGDIYNSSQVYLNAGLEDRLALAKWQGEENQTPKGGSKGEDPIYQKLLDFLIHIKNNIVGEPIGGGFEVDPTTMSNPPSGFLKSFMLRYNGDMNFKALIPFTLDVTLDGIGGFVIGQIFTVDKNILPKNYYDKKLGFIITGITHSLKDNDWETSLKTQICILDQEGLGSKLVKVDRTEFSAKLAAKINEAKIDAILYPIMSDFIELQFYKSLVGYMYASEGKMTDAQDILQDYLLKRDTEDFDEWWIYGDESNRRTKIPGQIDQFLKHGWFALSEFEIFVGAWVKKYKGNRTSDQLNVKITGDITLSQTLDDLIKPKADFALIGGQIYETYRENLEKISDYFNNSETIKQFYPNDSSLLYVKDNYPFVFYYADIYSTDMIVKPDPSKLRTYIKTLIESQFPEIVKYYNNLNTSEGTPISTLFSVGDSHIYYPLDVTDKASMTTWANHIIWSGTHVNGRPISEKLKDGIL